MNANNGNEAAKKLGATYHQVNVTDYAALSATFRDIFRLNKRLDFIYANAGVMERDNFYKRHETGDEPPPAPNVLPMDINANAVINTSYLAQHYFRQTPGDGTGPRSLIITASCGGLYACPASPIYSTSKFAALGLTRNIATPFWNNDGIRVNVSSSAATRVFRSRTLIQHMELGNLTRSSTDESTSRGDVAEVWTRWPRAHLEDRRSRANAVGR